MKSFMANPQNVERSWFVIDATGKSMGRLAATVAAILNGKNKVTYTQHVDCGDHVIVINSDKVVLTGNKLNQKFYRTHSGYAGGLKETRYDTLMRTRSDMAIKLAVKGMLPKNSIGRHSLQRLRVYKGAEHEHMAQKPVVID